jgi:hypothetical protein
MVQPQGPMHIINALVTPAPKIINGLIPAAVHISDTARDCSKSRREVKTMSEGKDGDRSRRKKRRGQLDREKVTRRAEQSRTDHLESKTKDEKAKLDLRIAKLIDQGYSPESVAKRVGVSVRRVNSALDSISRE